MKIFPDEVAKKNKYMRCKIVPGLDKEPRTVSFDVTFAMSPAALLKTCLYRCLGWTGFFTRRKGATVSGIFLLKQDTVSGLHTIDLKLFIEDHDHNLTGIVMRHFNQDAQAD